MTADVIPLARKPADEPLGKPLRCMTPKHEDRAARSYPGGRLCDHCIAASRQAMNNRNDEGGN